MVRPVLEKERCKGCFLCVSVCPRGVLYPSGIHSSKGWETAAAKDSGCIGCGACYRICPDCAIELLEDD